MRILIVTLLASSLSFAQSDLALSKARMLAREGDSLEALALLRSAAQQNPSDADAQIAYAEMLDLHRDPAARGAYERALGLMENAGSRAKAESAVRRLLVLDLLAGDNAGAEAHAKRFASIRGTDAAVPKTGAVQSRDSGTIDIPGPLRSFARMAALSPELPPEDLLSAMARNVVTNGYQAVNASEGLEPTEYLKLVTRYVSQARELEKIAGADKVLRVEQCESTQAADVLRVLGYRMRGGCGSDVVLETVNATRAFLTIDSGFPLADLEQALRANRPFAYDFKPATVPVLYGPEYWLTGSPAKDKGEFIDQFIGDPAMCRMYLGYSRLDDETAAEIRKAIPAQRLKAFSHVLDFYGGMFEIRNGKAVVPGGPAGAQAWTQMAGKSPDEGAAFLERLLTRDDGWMAAYYDALARMEPASRDYLLDPKRMQRFYIAIKGRVTSPGPARPVFRANTDMLLLTQRLRLDAAGRPHIPGGLEAWRNIFLKHPHAKYEGKQTRSPSTWKETDDLIEALFGLTRKTVENEPLRFFLVATDLDRYRPKPLEAATVDRLAREFKVYGAQYAYFNEIPTVSDATIVQYLDGAATINKVRDNLDRADQAGIFQALAGLWQILCRNRLIPVEQADAALSSVIAPFTQTLDDAQLFDAGRKGAEALLKAAKSPSNLSVQDAMIDLLAGTVSHPDSDSHMQIIQEMMQIFEAQKLISLRSIFDVADQLDRVAKGEKPDLQLVGKFNARVAEIQMPRSSLSAVEKNTLTFGYWTEKHVEVQRKVNLRVAIEKAGADKAAVRGQLVPFLRDTLVGFNYLHYAPPGAQILRTNPLFVRTHDFIGLQTTNQTWRSTEIYGTGWPANAGGRLVGSLVSLPYALAEAEQNFLIPTREQALIWGDLVPQMLISAKVPRWWSATPAQLSWVAVHMNRGESLLAESAFDPKLRAEVLDLLAMHAPPARVRLVSREVSEGRVKDAIEQVTPSEVYLLARDWWAVHKDDSSLTGQEARHLAAEHPDQVTPATISHAFGTPKPTLSHSYAPELLNLRTFPTLMGYSSRIMAESWESNLLYYAALANELHMRPSQLNVAVPQWTQQTVERIFATHLEDWPALLRSLRLVGDDVRTKARGAGGEQKASMIQ